jgi:hypothetical protein
MAADRGDFGPFPLPHVSLRVVNAKSLYLDYGVAGLGLRIRERLDDQAVQTAESLQYNSFHEYLPFVPRVVTTCRWLLVVCVLSGS